MKKFCYFGLQRLAKNDHIFNDRRQKILDLEPDFFSEARPITAEQIKIKYPEVFNLRNIVGTISSEALSESLISVANNIGRPDRNKLKNVTLNGLIRVYLNCEEGCDIPEDKIKEIKQILDRQNKGSSQNSN